MRGLRCVTILAAAGALFGAAMAQDVSQLPCPNPDRDRQIGTWSASVQPYLLRLQRAFEETDYARAEEALNDLLSRRGLKDYDYATAHFYRGQIRAQDQRVAEALQDLEQAISRSQGLKCSDLQQARYNTGLLHLSEERYDQALRYLETWLAEEPSPGANDYYTISTAYARVRRFDDAIRLIEQAISIATEPTKGHYQLANYLYSETNQIQKRREVLETLVSVWPDDRLSWIGLQGIYSQLNLEREAFSVLQLAYRAGLLEKETEIKALAQNYGFYGDPYRGAQILEREISAGTVPDSVENLETLGNLWLQAREAKRAQNALERAQRKSDDGDIAFRLAQTFAAQEEWDGVVNFATRAINKGGLGSDIGQAWVLKGSGEYYQGDRDTAVETFERAKNYDSVKSEATRWTDYIEKEKEAEEQQRRYDIQIQTEECQHLIEGYNDIVETRELFGEQAGEEPADVTACKVFLSENGSG